ncbi:hypothetical protein BDW_05940 [Bdellovibrio bacteriovorus W]|nr:hypothetical protein BDW_05940 [Bdellovibrio bacteriovorus W]
MNYRSFNDLSNDIRTNLYKINSQDFDLIVGIPRSGMIPAYMLSLYLNLHVTDVAGFINNSVLVNGTTRKVKNRLTTAWDAKKVLFVDDSISSGESLQKVLRAIPDELRHRVSTLAIYTDSSLRRDIDFTFEVVSHPRAFEWNIFHRPFSSSICFDIDGVLCVDPTDDENDDGPFYEEFLMNAKPRYLPSYKIFAIVTNRLEKYRLLTEEWLNKHGIQYDYLIMSEYRTADERRLVGNYSKNKANFYKNSKAILFIESDVRQAMEIAAHSGKPVFCTDSNKMYDSNIFSTTLKSPSYLSYKFRKRVMGWIPPAWKRRLKRILGR